VFASFDPLRSRTLTRMSKQARTAAAAAVTVALVAAIVAVVAISSGGGRSASITSAKGREAEFQGAAFPGAIAAPNFTLHDQYGGEISLSSYRGRVVMLTFLYSTCGDTCVVIGQQIRGALNELAEEHARLPAVLIVSADPAADTPSHVRRFLAEVSLTGRVQYLTGAPAQMRAVWHAYAVKPASDGAAVFDEYAPVLLIDGSGHKRVLFESEELTPEGLSHDVRRLYGDPTGP
jgi:protein SCO1/2